MQKTINVQCCWRLIIKNSDLKLWTKKLMSGLCVTHIRNYHTSCNAYSDIASAVYFYHHLGSGDYRILWGSIVMPTFFINLIEYFMILMVTQVKVREYEEICRKMNNKRHLVGFADLTHFFKNLGPLLRYFSLFVKHDENVWRCLESLWTCGGHI